MPIKFTPTTHPELLEIRHSAPCKFVSNHKKVENISAEKMPRARV